MKTDNKNPMEALMFLKDIQAMYGRLAKLNTDELTRTFEEFYETMPSQLRETLLAAPTVKSLIEVAYLAGAQKILETIEPFTSFDEPELPT